MATCCPKTFTGFCLDDQTPIAITIDNGVVKSWTNIVTGVVTPGPPPAGTGICEVPSVVTVDIEPLTCAKDAVTVCQGTNPWVVSGDITVEVAPLTCVKDAVTVCQGTDPWTVDGTVAATQSGVWTVNVVEPVTVDGTVALDAATLTALETITVNQGTSPWVVSGTVSVTEPVSVDDNGGSLTTDNPDIPDLTGTWAYDAGVSGVEVIGAGRRVIGIAAHAGILAGSMTINGGDVIPVPANSSITINPYGQLVAPTIVFTGTDSYFIETLI